MMSFSLQCCDFLFRAGLETQSRVSGSVPEKSEAAVALTLVCLLHLGVLIPLLPPPLRSLQAEPGK